MWKLAGESAYCVVLSLGKSISSSVYLTDTVDLKGSNNKKNNTDRQWEKTKGSGEM